MPLINDTEKLIDIKMIKDTYNIKDLFDNPYNKEFKNQRKVLELFCENLVKEIKKRDAESMIYIANLFSLIGTILGHITNLRKDRPKMLHNAVFTTLCNAMANFFAGSKAGGISCLCSTLRYYLIYKNVKPIIVCSIFIPTTTILILLNNTEGFLCLFPICSSIIAILTLCYVKDMRKMKAIFIITTSLIICHDLYFKLYISASSNIISIVENIIVIYRLSIEKRKQEKEKKQ